MRQMRLKTNKQKFTRAAKTFLKIRTVAVTDNSPKGVQLSNFKLETAL